MGTAEIIDALRSEAGGDSSERESAAQRLASIIPSGPLSDEFLDATLKGLEPLIAANLFQILAEMGRKEWVSRAVERLGGPDWFVELKLAAALISADDQRGVEALRRIYFENRDRKKGPNWVPTEWVFDVLGDHRGRPLADALRREIVAEESARYEARRKTS